MSHRDQLHQRHHGQSSAPLLEVVDDREQRKRQRQQQQQQQQVDVEGSIHEVQGGSVPVVYSTAFAGFTLGTTGSKLASTQQEQKQQLDKGHHHQKQQQQQQQQDLVQGESELLPLQHQSQQVPHQVQCASLPPPTSQCPSAPLPCVHPAPSPVQAAKQPAFLRVGSSSFAPGHSAAMGKGSTEKGNAPEAAKDGNAAEKKRGRDEALIHQQTPPQQQSLLDTLSNKVGPFSTRACLCRLL